MDFLTAFFAGVLSFLSPCVLPLVLPYLAYLTGMSLPELTEAKGRSFAVSIHLGVVAIFFVFGLTTVFMILGTGASLMGQFLTTYRETFNILSGITIFILGLNFWGFRRLPSLFSAIVFLAGLGLALLGQQILQDLDLLLRLFALILVMVGVYLSFPEELHFMQKDLRLQPKLKASGGMLNAYLMGLIFAFGWTPCIGPVLGSILLVAAAHETVVHGVFLLWVYAMGMGLPFLLAAFFAGTFFRWVGQSRFLKALNGRLTGLLLILTGALFVTGRFTLLSSWILGMMPWLAVVG